MAEDTSASVIPLHQVPPKKRGGTGAEPAKTPRQRKPRKPKVAVPTEDADSLSSESLIPPEYLSAHVESADPPVAPLPAVTSQPAVTLPPAEPVTPSSRRQLGSFLLSIAALALAGVGIANYHWSVTQNGLSFALPTGTTTNAANFQFTPATGGLYAVTLAVTDSDGETGSDTVSILVNATPSSVAFGAPSSVPVGTS